jgi:hypothetical protein
VVKNPGDPIFAASFDGVKFPFSGLKVAWYIPSAPRPLVPKRISIGLAKMGSENEKIEVKSSRYFLII